MYRKQLKRHSLAVSSSFLIKSERNANVLSWRIIRNSFIKKTAAPHKWNSLLHFPHDEVLRLSHISVHSSGVGSMGSFYMHERGRQGWEQEYSILLIHQQKIHQSNHRTKKNIWLSSDFVKYAERVLQHSILRYTSSFFFVQWRSIECRHALLGSLLPETHQGSLIAYSRSVPFSPIPLEGNNT